MHEQDTSNANYLLGLAKCSVRMNDPLGSEHWIKKLLRSDYAGKSEWFGVLALQSLRNGKIDEVRILLDSVDNHSTRNYLELSIYNRKSFLSDSNLYTIKPSAFNTSASEFSVLPMQGALAFLSSRDRKTWSNVKNLSDNSRYLDFYMVGHGDSTDVTLIESLTGKYHEGPGDLYEVNQKLVFTRSQVNGKSLTRNSKGVNKLDIYFATLESGEWTDIKPWELNTEEYSFGHPLINESGDSMIFVADLPGGYGGTDLYSSVFDGVSWTEPVNLGERYNSPGNEMFPTFIDQSTISFASNGWPGLGGLDIFLQDNVSEENPTNIGAPINSSKDDFALIFTGQNEGFFSSDRRGSDDVFRFEGSYYDLKVVIADQYTKSPLSNIKVFINSGIDSLKWLKTDTKGLVKTKIPMTDSTQLKVTLDNYLPFSDSFLSSSIPDTIFMSRPSLELVITDFSGVRIKSAIHYMHPEATRATLSPIQNYYLINSGEKYVYFVSAPGYYSHRDTVLYDKFSANKTLYVKLKEVVKGESMRLEHIYYELNKSNLTKESEAELDKLVQFMKDNEEIKIELSSHTDSRGSDEYNLKLSQRRAQSATDYLVSKGVQISRIKPVGYGESKPVNRCVNGIRCSAEEYQANRRTEIKIL